MEVGLYYLKLTGTLGNGVYIHW